MTTLIPDARRSLLGGLVDDAALLGAAAPAIDSAVREYRELRASRRGWMVGRLVVPVSLLEDLAGVLVRTMKGGDSPIPIVAVFDGNTASDASKASAFHATMDPGARVDVVRLAVETGRSAASVVEAANSTRGIHHDVLPMMLHSPNESATPTLAAISTAEEAVLHSVGLTIDVPPDTSDVSTLASSIRACTDSSTPFTIQAAWFPASTMLDQPTGSFTVGAMNILAAVVQTGATAAETTATLSDDDPAMYTVGFAGLSMGGAAIRSGRSIGTDRTPLLSLSALDPAATIDGLGALDPYA